MKRSPSLLWLLAPLALGLGSAVGQDLEAAATMPGGSIGPPARLVMRKAGESSLDLRDLPPKPLRRRFRREPPEPKVVRGTLPGGIPGPLAPPVSPRAPAPSPILSFLGLDFANWGAGRPPDTVGDVGPNHYIQSVNSSVAIYRKSDQARLVAMTLDTFMSAGTFGNLCDTDNFGDPVVLYDTFDDRWVVTDFAFQTDPLGIVNPPGAFQCFAVSKTSDPVAGGWNYYFIQLTDALDDYPKFGVWPDGLYMSANMFPFANGGSFIGTRVWVFNKADMYAGEPTVRVLTFDPPVAEFTLLPANARIQTGTPPAGSPNYFAVIWQDTNAVRVYKFHADWTRQILSTFTGPSEAVAPASWLSPPTSAPSQGGHFNDTLAVRLMMQNQYTNLDGVESLWNAHTVRHSTTTGIAVPRWYQTVLTAGNVSATTTQAANHEPDTTVNRYMPSLAVDRAGNLALGYSASSSTLFPAIRYAARLASDPLSTLPQTETSLVEGTGSQNVGFRWGDYSAMSLDPDGCTFWYSNEYYATTGGDWQTRIGTFKFPPADCSPLSNTGTVSGTVTAQSGGAPIGGATVGLGARTATTNGAGFYTFSNVPQGTYPTISASIGGFVTGTASGIAVTDGMTTTQDFALAAWDPSGCITDTALEDFETGDPNLVSLTSNPGSIVLDKPTTIEPQNTTVGGGGPAIDTQFWGGQTFLTVTPGDVIQVDVKLFCFSMTGTTPDILVSIRDTTGSPPVPTGGDLKTASIPGFNSCSPQFRSAVFASPASISPGMTYAVVMRPASNPSAGGYGYVRSGSSDPYAPGSTVASGDGGASWSETGPGDAGFKITMHGAFAETGSFVSGVKDANPAPGFGPTWQTLSWTQTVQPSTILQFQLAGSNSPVGPFNFIGPGGTSGSFYNTSGVPPLTQFNGFRYLKYLAKLHTSIRLLSPRANSVTLCYDRIMLTATPTATITPTFTITSTPTITQTPTITPTPTDTPTSTSTPTVTATFTSTPSATFTLTAAASATWTPTVPAGTSTGTATPDGSGTSTTTPTPIPPLEPLSAPGTPALLVLALGLLVGWVALRGRVAGV